MTREQRNVLFYDPMEEEARMQMQMLNEEQDVSELIEVDEDHASFLLVYHRALDNKYTRKAIDIRRQLLIQQARQKVMQPQPQQMGQMGNIALNSMLTQGQEQGASSLLDIKTQ